MTFIGEQVGKLKTAFYQSTHDFYRRTKEVPNTVRNEDLLDFSDLALVRNEKFGFFYVLEIGEDACFNLGRDKDLAWWGPRLSYRVEIDSKDLDVSYNFVDYVKFDGCEKADIISNSSSKTCEAGEVIIFVELKTGARFLEIQSFRICVYEVSGFNCEKLIIDATHEIKVINFLYSKEISSEFFMDLWQHPSSWARHYNLEYFSNRHFELIEEYLKSLSELNQKVASLVVSDFPWAGQGCFDVKDCPSRLYEYNILKVERAKGKLLIDFSLFDKYLELCEKYGIFEEINLFGLIGNWHRKKFSSPIKDYKDPIRIRLYNLDNGVFEYIDSKDDLKEYLYRIFKHLDDLELLSKTKIVCDEPFDSEHLVEFQDFISSAYPKKIAFKCAIDRKINLKNFGDEIDSFSFNIRLLGEYANDHSMPKNLEKNLKKVTWYSCCFPKTFNLHYRNPLIESRLMGIYTLLFGMKGMLRWAYAIYNDDPFTCFEYNKDEWPAGDMALVYPSKDMKVLHSIRERNILYSIQDFNILKFLDKIGQDVKPEFEKKLGIEKLIYCVDGDVVLSEYRSQLEYMKIRNEFIFRYIA